MERAKIGKLGELLASKFLAGKNLAIIGRNYKNPGGRLLGEIDIVAEDKKTGEIVFVEVKTRSASDFDRSLPEENITPSKLTKLSRIAAYYLKENRLENRPYHFDAISIVIDEKTNKASVRHLPYL